MQMPTDFLLSSVEFTSVDNFFQFLLLLLFRCLPNSEIKKRKVLSFRDRSNGYNRKDTSRTVRMRGTIIPEEEKLFWKLITDGWDDEDWPSVPDVFPSGGERGILEKIYAHALKVIGL